MARFKFSDRIGSRKGGLLSRSSPGQQTDEDRAESWLPPEERAAPGTGAAATPLAEHSEGEAPQAQATGDDSGEQGASESPTSIFDWPQRAPSSTAGQPQSGEQSRGDGEPRAQGEDDRESAGDDESDQRGQAQGRDDGDPDEQERDGQDAQQERGGSRVSVVDEQPSRPEPPPGADEEEYKWHTYVHYPSGRPDAVEFVDTYKAFGRNHILRGLNMGLPEGMVSMILGPSGTGKSVCIKHMVGLLYPDEGDILVHGESVPNMADDDLFEMRKKFGLLFQDGALFGSMNIFDNVAFPLRQHTEKGEDEISDIVTRRLDEVGLGAHGDKLPNELSGGMRKRAGFARALVLEPDIVLFDEPDSGLDPVRTALLGELILEIHRDMMDEAKEKQREHLPTFAVITHDIMSARRVADYINVLWRGRIVEAGPAEDMLNSENPFIRQFLAGESQGPLTMD